MGDMWSRLCGILCIWGYDRFAFNEIYLRFLSVEFLYIVVPSFILRFNLPFYE